MTIAPAPNNRHADILQRVGRELDSTDPEVLATACATAAQYIMNADNVTLVTPAIVKKLERHLKTGDTDVRFHSAFALKLLPTTAHGLKLLRQETVTALKEGEKFDDVNVRKHCKDGLKTIRQHRPGWFSDEPAAAAPEETTAKRPRTTRSARRAKKATP